MAVRRVFDTEARTTTLLLFNGEGDVRFFIASLDYHFESEDIPEPCRVAIAKECIGKAIRRTLRQLARLLGNVSKRPWVWTWAGLKFALLKIQG